MKFRYVGEEMTEWFGLKWAPGTQHDVEDAHAIGKLTNSVLFEAVEGESIDPVKNKGGRPRKTVMVEAEANGDDQN
ncbi:MAG: hypothetical protein IPL32_18620 [Chloracidobacterium sp.]|nr:hypothetical protein [Chloracidobacterium sp.]